MPRFTRRRRRRKGGEIIGEINRRTGTRFKLLTPFDLLIKTRFNIEENLSGLEKQEFNEKVNKMPLDELNLLDNQNIICRIDSAKLNELNPAVLNKLVSCPEKLIELSPDVLQELSRNNPEVLEILSRSNPEVLAKMNVGLLSQVLSKIIEHIVDSFSSKKGVTTGYCKTYCDGQRCLDCIESLLIILNNNQPQLFLDKTQKEKLNEIKYVNKYKGKATGPFSLWGYLILIDYYGWVTSLSKYLEIKLLYNDTLLIRRKFNSIPKIVWPILRFPFLRAAFAADPDPAPDPDPDHVLGGKRKSIRKRKKYIL